MDPLSQLLQEAKPLYFARKRRIKYLRRAAVVLICIMGLNVFYPRPYEYMDYMGAALDNAQYGSVISDMGLPTDEYGLLMVG